MRAIQACHRLELRKRSGVLSHTRRRMAKVHIGDWPNYSQMYIMYTIMHIGTIPATAKDPSTVVGSGAGESKASTKASTKASIRLPSASSLSKSLAPLISIHLEHRHGWPNPRGVAGSLPATWSVRSSHGRKWSISGASSLEPSVNYKTPRTTHRPVSTACRVGTRQQSGRLTAREISAVYTRWGIGELEP
jgi:hypothetical protein